MFIGVSVAYALFTWFDRVARDSAWLILSDYTLMMEPCACIIDVFYYKFYEFTYVELAGDVGGSRKVC